MKNKLIISIFAIMIAATFTACGDNGDMDNSLSSVVSKDNGGNAPEGNTDGNYDDDNISSKNDLGDDISNIMSSGKEMLSSIMEK